MKMREMMRLMWIDKQTLMAQEEVEKLDESVELLHLLLTKIS